MKTSNLSGVALDWAVAKANSFKIYQVWPDEIRVIDGRNWIVYSPSTDWMKGGPIIERENITLIRANSQYVEGKSVPLWFAETDKWVGHGITTGYAGEYFDLCFMVDEAGGYYGPTPLIAAMRCYVASKIGDEIDIPEELK